MALALATGACVTASAPAPSYPATSVERLTVHSSALARDMPVLVFRARALDATKPFAVLYLFHGYGADESAWFDGYGGDGVHVDGIAQSLIDAGAICPVVIASAYIANSYGVDSQPASDQFDHGLFARYLTDELEPSVESAIGYRGGATSRFVGGLSMGGFAALHLVLSGPATFAGVGALSPAAFVTTPTDRQWLFDGDPTSNDPMLLAATADVSRLQVFIGYGRTDYGWVQDGAGELSRRLSRDGLRVVPDVVSGGHDVGTWRQLAGPMLEALLGKGCGPA